jgi:hypothetical protein
MENAVLAVPKLVEVLTGLSSEERSRAVSAAMLLLGETSPLIPGAPRQQQHEHEHDDFGEGISSKAAGWMAKNHITREQLEHIFSIDGKIVEIIAHKMPSTSKRKQTAEAYILAGLMSYIHSGEMEFSDDVAREVCRKVGCYDQANHSNYMKGFENWISGSKSGWKLSNPGLTKAAEIVKASAPATNA